MDFIERLLGLAPDGGNGLIELMLFLIPLAVLVLKGKRYGQPEKQ